MTIRLLALALGFAITACQAARPPQDPVSITIDGAAFRPGEPCAVSVLAVNPHLDALVPTEHEWWSGARHPLVPDADKIQPNVDGAFHWAAYDARNRRWHVGHGMTIELGNASPPVTVRVHGYPEADRAYVYVRPYGVPGGARRFGPRPLDPRRGVVVRLHGERDEIAVEIEAGAATAEDAPAATP